MNPKLLQNYSKRKFTIQAIGSLRKNVDMTAGEIHVVVVGRKRSIIPFHYSKKIEIEVKGLGTASSSVTQPNEVCTIVT